MTELAAERVQRLTGRQRRLDVEIAAKEVLDILMELDGDLITYDQLARSTELSRSSVLTAVNYLKDQILGVEGVSFIAEHGRGGGIALTRDSSRAMAYVLLRARLARKQQQRLIDATIAPMTRYAAGTDVAAEAEAIERNQRRVVEDMDAMIQRLEGAGVTTDPANITQRSEPGH